jgi:hypothetical protein
MNGRDNSQSATAILESLSTLLRSAPSRVPHDLPPSEHSSGQPAWHPIEHDIWAEGEALRQYRNRSPRAFADPLVIDAVLKIIECRAFRRGRQSFVMLLETPRARQFAARLAPLLSDPDIAGHVLTALLRMRALEYSALVRPLTQSPFAWVRRRATAYLARAEATGNSPFGGPPTT